MLQALHQDTFPTKSCLQLKIREVRQKVMAQSATPSSAGNSVPSAGSSAGAGANSTPAQGSADVTESADGEVVVHDTNDTSELGGAPNSS